MNFYISEFQEAQGRFEKNTTPCNDSNGESRNLDNIIESLLRKEKIVDIGHDSRLFYDLISYADYIQIKNELLGTFYSELCRTFILSSLLEDIVKNFERLEEISHVKMFLAWGLILMFPLRHVFVDSSLVLSYSGGKTCHQSYLHKVNNITILPSAYKIMMSITNFDFTLLNIILRFFEVKKLSLSGCNLNWRNTDVLFVGLELVSLNLSESGTIVNQIIQQNSCGLFSNLKELDVSGNPLFNETLKSIRSIPLKYLNISNCIKTSGKFINSIWFVESIASQMGPAGKQADVNVDILWQDGRLRESIKILNISSNELSRRNFIELLKVQLEELDMSDTFICNSYEFCNFVFPSSLKILKTNDNSNNFEHFTMLCGTSLEKLEMNYRDKFNDDYSTLQNTPLTKSLRELSLCVMDPSEAFISFISKLKLKSFSCEGRFSNSQIGPLFNRFITGHSTERRCLDTLQIGMPYFSFFDKKRFFKDFRTLNLKELSLLSLPTFDGIGSFLTCENLQESIETLKLGEHFTVKDEDLVQLTKFKKLNRLSFAYKNDIREEYLKNVVEIRTLNELKLTAIIDETLNLKFARLMCIAPVHILRIFSGGTITDEAYVYLLDENNSARFSENLVSLISSCSNFEKNFATILKHANWEEILLMECTWTDRSSDIMFNNEHLFYTLNDFGTSLHVNEFWDWKNFGKVKLSKFKSNNGHFTEKVMRLEDIPFSEFLFSLTLSRYMRSEDIDRLYKLLDTNISVVNDYNYHYNATHRRCFGTLSLPKLP